MATADEAIHALVAWNIEPCGELEQVIPHRVFKVRQKSGVSLILKDVSKQRFESLSFELDVIGHLDREGIPVAVPIKAINGQQIIDMGDVRYTLAPSLLADGAKEPGEWVDRVPSYGAIFAELHLALKSYPNAALAAKAWSSDPVGESFDQYIPNLLRSLPDQQVARLSEIASGIEGEMRRALNDLPIQLIHRDLHDGNIISSGNRVIGIVDCDHFSFGTPMIDVAYFLHHTIKWLKREDGTMVGNEDGKVWWLSWVPNLLRAYDEVRPLSARERAALPYLMVWVTVSFVDFFLKKGKREEVQLYLHLLDFVYEYRDEIARSVESKG
jgi:Ser/Thr protein kinase RdoA (MazF antagonist)